jgi:hypothetical protein
MEYDGRICGSRSRRPDEDYGRLLPLLFALLSDR